MQKITPFLWFDGNAEAAMNFYMAHPTIAYLLEPKLNGCRIRMGGRSSC